MRGATLHDRALLLLLPLPGGLHLLLGGEDITGTVVVTQRHIEVTDWALGGGAVGEVATGMSATISKD